MDATSAFLTISTVAQFVLGAALLAYTSRLLQPKLARLRKHLLRRAR